MELHDQAIRLVFELAEEQGDDHGVIPTVAERLGISMSTMYRWVREAEQDGLWAKGAAQRARIAQLERENRELQRANEILKAASTFFAAELDRHESR